MKPLSSKNPFWNSLFGLSASKVVAPRSRTIVLVLSLYAGVAVAALIAGYLWRYSHEQTSSVYLAEPPETAPDLEFMESLKKSSDGFTEIDSFHGVLKNAVVITEVGQVGGGQTNHYICPKSADSWGEVELRWEWDVAWKPSLAILYLHMHVFPQFDRSAIAELYLASEATDGRWDRLVIINAMTHEHDLMDTIDVTPWVARSRYLKVRYRLRATRLIYHPTPNDPIGLAGAQCLRQSENAKFATKFSLWKDLPEGYESRAPNPND